MFCLSLLVADPAGAVDGAQGDSAVLSGGAGEYYIAALPPQWVVNGQNNGPKGATSNWVPQTQVGEDWRELISLQIYTGLSEFPFATFLEGMIARYRTICDEVFATETEENLRNDFPVAFRILACTKSTRNELGEISLFNVVSGKQALYVAQRVYRVPPFTPQNFPLAAERLTEGRAAIEFGLACQRGGQSRACPDDWLGVLDALGSSAAPIVIFPAAR